MNQIFRGLLFVTIYTDDVLVHSANEKEHVDYLRQVFQCLRDAGLTLRGRKCHIAIHVASEVLIGHIFSASGISPEPRPGESSGSPRMADTNECHRSMLVSRSCIILLPIYSPVCQHCKAIECTDAEDDTIHLVQRV